MTEEVRNQDEDDKEQSDFFQSMKPMQKEDIQQLLAWYEDVCFNGVPVRCGGRVRFDLKTRNVILEIKVGDRVLVVECSLKSFVKKLTGVAISELWGDAGLIP